MLVASRSFSSRGRRILRPTGLSGCHTASDARKARHKNRRWSTRPAGPDRPRRFSEASNSRPPLLARKQFQRQSSTALRRPLTSDRLSTCLASPAIIVNVSLRARARAQRLCDLARPLVLRFRRGFARLGSDPLDGHAHQPHGRAGLVARVARHARNLAY